MKISDASAFHGTWAWDALDIAEIDGFGVRLHWTDKAYVWHVNDGTEIFVVIDGAFDMHVRGGEREDVHRLRSRSIFHAGPGDEHKAVPLGVARALVVERAGSI